jgi:hypothetical protein
MGDQLDLGVFEIDLNSDMMVFDPMDQWSCFVKDNDESVD